MNRPLDTASGLDIYSISRLASELRAALDGGFPLLWVRGEISNLARPASGHLYFSLKDTGAQVRCAMFRARRLLLTFPPANGQEVLARARVSFYEPRGDVQLIVEHLEPAGEGTLRLAFEALQRRLAAEGLFDPSIKRPLPPIPRQVGLITSPTGAAVRDLLAVFQRRFPGLPLLIYPALVQGEAAPDSLIAALRLANERADCEVLILARGGGSLEDLAAFNDEALARAIRASRIPVVSGVGHETDLTIADLVADQRAATPSAAAELVAPSGTHLLARIETLRGRARRAQLALHERHGQRLRALSRHLDLLHPLARLRESARRLGELGERLRRQVGHIVERRRDRLRRAAIGLDARSPLGTLARGYAIVRLADQGSVVRHPDQAPPGAQLDVRLAQGAVRARVLAAAADPGPGSTVR